MTHLTRREFLASGVLLPTAVCTLPFCDEGDSAAQSLVSHSYPTLHWEGSGNARIDLRGALPSPVATRKFEMLLRAAQSARRIVVRSRGRIAPIPGFDDRYSEWITLCEQYGVNEVVETSNRGAEVTPPIRVGQVDPVGIIYRINGA